jgi:hypothetical protein
MRARIRKDDISHWLTVAATPTAMYLPKNPRTRNIGVFCSGRHAWRYPWQAQFTSARPGRPHWSVADFGAREPSKQKLVPAIPGSPAAAYLRREMERLQAVAKDAGNAEVKRGAELEAERIRTRLEQMARGKRHPNGGGWVQSTARADDTAYVGPNAMVLDRAQVLGSASIEDFAVVRDSARVEDHARVFGASNIRGNDTVIGGYARAWLADRKSPSAPEKSAPKGKFPVVPVRPGAESLRPDGLWIHYAMDAPNNVTLEDYYRYRAEFSHGHNRALVPSPDGYTHSKPAFVQVDGRCGLRFDGDRQYAEVNPRAVDLGEATIVATVRRESKSAGTVFDFGVSEENRMVLRLDRRGRPTFDATVGGKVVLELRGRTAVPVDQWARLRLEFDGRVGSLWLVKDAVARKSSSFRPCHVFPPDTTRLNTIAISRDMRNGFAGTFESLVIYHKVHLKFDTLPAPITDAPVRPTAKIIARIEKQLGDAQEVESKVRRIIRDEMAPYNAIYKRCKARQEELLLRNAGVRRAREALAAGKAGLEKKKRTLVDEVNRDPANAELIKKVERLRADSRAAAGKMHARVRKLVEEDAAHNKYRTEADRIHREEMEPIRKAFFEKAKRERPNVNRKDLERELARDPAYMKADARRSKLRTKANERSTELRETVGAEFPETIEYFKLNRQRGQMERQLREVREAHVNKGIDEATRRINELAKKVNEAEEEAWKRYGPEKGWLKSFEFAGFRGYYNTAYNHYFEKRVRAIVGGGEMRENTALLRQVQQAYADPTCWHTKVDWDWRMPEEINGEIDSMPLMKQWLERTRGPVAKAKPTSAKQ